ncbi:MAG TPA: hypothetical protein VKL40_07730, partial [Candidatus Angelobacter sp.]|nr:hypothetical protein [Candidatus Angelobacter sp.]
MRRTWVVLFNLLLATLFGGLLTGCENTTVQGALPPLPRQGPSPTPTPSPTPPPTPTPTPTPFPTPTSSPTPTPTPIASRITSSRLIVGTPGFESGSVHVGVINRDGSISRAAGSPFDEGLGQPSVIQVTGDPKGRFVFVLNVEAQAAGELIGRPGLCGFAINSKTGTLSRVPGSPIVFPVRNDNNIVVDGSGHFLF